MESKYLLLSLLILVFFLLKKLRLVEQNQRLAEYILGKFTRFVGPGLHFKLSGADTKWQKLSLGERGELLNSTLGRFGNIEVPIESVGSLSARAAIRVTGFRENTAIIQFDENPRTYKCNKCGHENAI